MGNVTKLFKGTPFDHIVKFTGKIREVPIPKKKLKDEEYVRDMTILEKRLFTLWQRKVDERDDLIVEICGVNPKTVETEEDRLNYEKALTTKVTHEEHKQIDEIWKQANFYDDILWMIVFSNFEIPEGFKKIEDLASAFRPEWKIVIGKHDEQKSGKIIEGLKMNLKDYFNPS